MTERTPLPPINFAALAAALLGRVDALLPAWLPGGAKRGHEYVCGSLSGDKGSSCSINTTTGQWADFASDAKGRDLVSLYAAIHDLGMGHAAVQVAREEGLEDVAGVQPAREGDAAAPQPPRPAPEPKAAAAPARPDEGWVTCTPVPANAPKPTFWHHVKLLQDIAHKAVYSIDGKLFGYVVRFTTSEGGKETLPYTWCTSARDGASKWHWRGFDEPRPLYFPAGASPMAASGVGGFLPTVILVEGEKKAGLLQALLDLCTPGVYLVASWPGGCKAWKKADWSWLNGCTVLLWPDCDGKRAALTKKERDACLDEVGRAVAAAAKPVLPANEQPGMLAMLGIGALLRDSHACKVSMLPIPAPLAVVDGWDCADAITTDGWDGERVLAFFGQAQALIAPTSEPVAAKKIEGPVSTEGAVFDTAGTTMIGGRAIPDWLLCYYNQTKKYWFTSRKMVIAILENDPDLAPVLSYNELSNTVQSRTAWPWPYAPAGDVTDAVDLMLGKYLSDKYGLPSIPRAALIEAIQTVAHTRRFHPIREYLQGAAWDGAQRIDKWLMHALGETPESISRAMAEYLQIVGRCWLLGMVKRALEPGCKFDYCPVLEGVGGLRKSTLVEILAGSDFYSDTPFDIGHGKEAQEQVQGRWLYEIAEMSNFSKAEVGSIKGFISSKVDRYRVAYGTTVGQFPRQCVLVGTTNENTYLRDRTGNRRFWPIPVRNIIRTEWVQKYRDLLFAEAYALVAANPHLQYTPTPEQERRLFAPMQASRLQETAVASELQHLFTRPPNATASGELANDLTQFVTLAQVTKAMGIDAAKCPAGVVSEIRGWFTNQGWASTKKQIHGVRANGYARPANWPPQDDNDEMIEAPQAGGVVVEPEVQDGDDAPF
jgi:predicted P-loop ATPase